MKILVADDSDLVRDRLVGKLSETENLGGILKATSGLEARDMIVMENLISQFSIFGCRGGTAWMYCGMSRRATQPPKLSS